MAAIQKELQLDDNTTNWFASILVVGQILGCVLGGMVTDRWGRRRVLMVFLSLSFVGWSIVAASSYHPDQGVAVTSVFLGRFLHGLADSLGVSPAIIMVSEITTVKRRGMFMNTAAVAASSGIPLAYIIGSFCTWQTTAWVGSGFPLLGVLIFLLAVHEESPLFLLTRGRRSQSLAALRWYRQGVKLSEVDQEFKAMEETDKSADESRPEEKACLGSFRREETWRPFLIVMVLLGLVPLTGIMSVTFFAIEMLEGLGFKESTLFVAVSAGTLRAIGSAMAGVIVVFKGRRFVLLFSCFGAILAIEVATAAMIVRDHLVVSPTCDYILIGSIPAYMFFLGIGITPVPWILLGEWFVSRTRSVAGGVASANFFLSALVSLQMTSWVEKTIGVHGMFTSFGFICVLLAVLAWKLVPETHGKTYRDSVLLKRWEHRWMASETPQMVTLMP